jgi:hypothetical protein
VSGEPDYIVLRHGPDVPDEYRVERYEGRWLDRQGSVFRIAKIGEPGPVAIAEPSGRFEYRGGGAVAEVWEIRLATPNERQ